MGIAELIANAWNSAAATVDQYALKARKGLKSSDLQSSLFDTEGQASLPGMGKKSSDWDEDAHPRAAKGATGVHGGQFVKKDESPAVGGKESADELRAEKRKHDEANYRKHLSLLQDEALDRTADMLRNSPQSEESQIKLAAVSEELSKRSSAPKRPKGIRDPLEGLNQPVKSSASANDSIVHFQGDKGRLTGKVETIHGGEFHEIEMLEGRHKGKMKWQPTQKQSEADTAKFKSDWKSQQEGFARIKEMRKAGLSEDQIQDIESNENYFNVIGDVSKASDADLNRAHGHAERLASHHERNGREDMAKSIRLEKDSIKAEINRRNQGSPKPIEQQLKDIQSTAQAGIAKRESGEAWDKTALAQKASAKEDLYRSRTRRGHNVEAKAELQEWYDQNNVPQDKRLKEFRTPQSKETAEQPVDKVPIPIRERKTFAESLAKQGKSQSEIAEAMVKRGVALSDANRLASKATGDQGPKDGDVNAEGLVFRNGRWHREEETKPEPVASDKSIALPEGWSESSPGGMATDGKGNIVDKEIASGKWFVIHDGEPLSGLDSREAAFDALKNYKPELPKAAEAERKPGEPIEPPKEPEAPKAPVDQTPSEEATSERDKAIESGKTPRQAAERSQKKLDQDYEFARASEVANAGEDLKGSARHRVNAWKGLAEAEKDGTAAAMVTRDQLLKLEPHDLFIHADKNPLTALAMHYALKAFPAKPGTGKGGDHEKDRKQYLEAYQDIKKKAEELAKTKDSTDVVPAIKELQTHVGDLIQKLRGQKSKDSMGMATATDKYNQTANDLVNLHRALATDWRSRKTGVAGKTVEFGNAVKERYGDMSVENIADHAKDIMEGKSLNTTFDREKKSVDRFDPADLYVKIATRTGGRDLSSVTSDANKATKHMVDTMGLRGVQWGNSVTDDERKHHAAKSVEALTDLADVLGLHPKDIALDGKLGLAIGARGRGGAVAHYEPTQKVINLTRKNGVGSLAHEWAHGFDHTVNGDDGRYLSEDTDTHETQQKGSATWRGRTSNPERMEKMGYTVTERPLSEVRQTMSGVHDAQRDYRKRLLEFISNSGLSAKKAAYWASEKEIFARTFERYVQHKLEQSGKKNTYLAGIETKAHKAGGFWPTDDEVKAMAPAFDKFFDAYRKHKHGSAEKVKFSRREALEAFAPARFRPVLLAN